MPKYLPKLKSNAGIGISLGVLYGLVLRIAFEWKLTTGVLEIISTSFLIVAPFAVGAISVFFMPRDRHYSYKAQSLVATITMLFFLLAMFILVLEGLICIILILPVFLIASIIGGLVMGAVIKHTSKARSTLNCLVLLPFILSAFEANRPVQSTSGTVVNSVIVEASPEAIFSQIANVKNIDATELGFSFMHVFGLPRPLEAAMTGEGTGAVRVSKWQQGVSFKERISLWQAPQKMYYEFDIPPGSIPKEALDRHVELGGKYFTVSRGGYDIEPLGNNRCRLSLHTVFVNKSNLKLYGDLWSTIALADFHHAILHLIKVRAEKNR